MKQSSYNLTNVSNVRKLRRPRRVSDVVKVRECFIILGNLMLNNEDVTHFMNNNLLFVICNHSQ